MKRTRRLRRTLPSFSAFETRAASAILAALLRIQRKIENALAYLLSVFSARRDIAISVAGHEKIHRHCHLEYNGRTACHSKLIVRGIAALRCHESDGRLYRIRNHAGRGNVQYHVFRHGDGSGARTGLAVRVGKSDRHGYLNIAGHPRVAAVLGYIRHGQIGYLRRGRRGLCADKLIRSGEIGRRNVRDGELQIGHGALTHARVENLFCLYASLFANSGKSVSSYRSRYPFRFAII